MLGAAMRVAGAMSGFVAQKGKVTVRNLGKRPTPPAGQEVPQSHLYFVVQVGRYRTIRVPKENAEGQREPLGQRLRGCTDNEQRFIECFLTEYAVCREVTLGTVARACYRLRAWGEKELGADASCDLGFEVKAVLDDVVRCLEDEPELVPLVKGQVPQLKRRLQNAGLLPDDEASAEEYFPPPPSVPDTPQKKIGMPSTAAAYSTPTISLNPESQAYGTPQAATKQPSPFGRDQGPEEVSAGTRPYGTPQHAARQADKGNAHYRTPGASPTAAATKDEFPGFSPPASPAAAFGSPATATRHPLHQPWSF